MFDEYDIKMAKAIKFIRTGGFTTLGLAILFIGAFLLTYNEYDYELAIIMGIGGVFIILSIIMLTLKSRIAAWILLLIALLPAIDLLANVSGNTIRLSFSGIIVWLATMYIYTLALKGTYLYHKLKKENIPDSSYNPITCPDCNKDNSPYDRKCIHSDSQLNKKNLL